MATQKTLTVELADVQIKFWTNVKETLLHLDEKDSDDIETRIVKKYLKFGSLVDVAAELNKEGYRTPSKRPGQLRQFCSNDISDVIRSCSIEDGFMLSIARKLLDNHCEFINKLFG